MITRELEVENELGLHARVASRIVREAKKFSSSVIIRKGGETFDLKNVMGVIMINAKKGDFLTAEFSGEDEEQASQAISGLFAQKFGER